MKEITYESAIRAMYVSNLDSMSRDWIIEKLKRMQAEQPAQEDGACSCPMKNDPDSVWESFGICIGCGKPRR